MLFLDVRTEALTPRKLGLRVIYQNRRVAAMLPFEASNGVLLTSFPSGRVSVGSTSGRKLVVALRGQSCPTENWHDTAVVDIGEADKAVASIRTAVAELRRRLQERRAG